MLLANGFRPDEVGVALCHGLGTVLHAAQAHGHEAFAEASSAVRREAARHAARRLAGDHSFSPMADDAVAEDRVDEAFEVVQAMMKEFLGDADEAGWVDLDVIIQFAIDEIVALDLTWTDAAEICDLALDSMIADEMIDDERDLESQEAAWYN